MIDATRRRFAMKRSRTITASIFLASLVLTLILTTTTARVAQVTSGSINGTVKDSSGGVVSGATVTIANPLAGLERTGSPNGAGAFVVPNLPRGTYTMRVGLQGVGNVE